jgi:hypothetical protein
MRATSPSFNSTRRTQRRNGSGNMGPPPALYRQTSKTSVLSDQQLRSPGGPSTSAAAWEKSRDNVKRRATAVINENGNGKSGYISASSSVSDMRDRANSFSSVDSVVQNNKRPPPRQTASTGTDPQTISAITQTMIGEYAYKYTRRAIGRGMSENRHKRFFWVHPYTKTLYWSAQDPGASAASESKAKSGKYCSNNKGVQVH